LATPKLRLCLQTNNVHTSSTNEQKGFTIVGTKTLKETLKSHVLLKPVAFDIKDESYGQQLYEHFLSITKDDKPLQTSLTKIGERAYLLGSVTKESKNQMARVSKKIFTAFNGNMTGLERHQLIWMLS
jgi:hypothetical protein